MTSNQIMNRDEPIKKYNLAGQTMSRQRVDGWAGPSLPVNEMKKGACITTYDKQPN